ncbi:MAG: M48 family metallopeptidase [Bacteroidales bacterium]
MNTLFLIIIILLTVGFVSDLVLDVLNLNHIRPELPRLLKNKYDPDAYRKSQSYLKEHGRFGILVSVISFAAVLLMLLLGGFAWLNGLVFSVTTHPVTAALFFFGILGFAADLAGTPFEIYSTFVIEEKFGFNKTTPVTFILDKLKSWLLAIIIGAPLMALIIWLYTLTGKWFWLLAWVIISVFSILLSFFYSTLIVPLFNKQQPLEEGDLRSAIEEMSRNAGFQLSKIFVINGSKRSTKANAYFAGFGSKRRIVLYDTLINDLTTNQILAVLTHEIGHYKKKHVISTMILSVLQTGVLLFLFSLVAGNPSLAAALNIAQPSFHISVLVFGILYSPVSMLIGLLFNYLSRRFEFQADAFAAKLGYHEDLGNALIGLSEKNLGNLTPHPAYVFVHYSHPPLLQRLNQLV